MNSALNSLRPSTRRSRSSFEPPSTPAGEEERGRGRTNLNYTRGPSPAYTRTANYVPMRSSSPINETSRSPSRSRGRAAGFKALTGALGVGHHEEDGTDAGSRAASRAGSRAGSRSGSRINFEKDEEKHWREFKKGLSFSFSFCLHLIIPPPFELIH